MVALTQAVTYAAVLAQGTEGVNTQALQELHRPGYTALQAARLKLQL